MLSNIVRINRIHLVNLFWQMKILNNVFIGNIILFAYDYFSTLQQILVVEFGTKFVLKIINRELLVNFYVKFFTVHGGKFYLKIRLIFVLKFFQHNFYRKVDVENQHKIRVIRSNTNDILNIWDPWKNMLNSSFTN